MANHDAFGRAIELKLMRMREDLGKAQAKETCAAAEVAALEEQIQFLEKGQTWWPAPVPAIRETVAIEKPAKVKKTGGSRGVRGASEAAAHARSAPDKDNAAKPAAESAANITTGGIMPSAEKQQHYEATYREGGAVKPSGSASIVDYGGPPLGDQPEEIPPKPKHRPQDYGFVDVPPASSPIVSPPSVITPPSKEQLMGGPARPTPHPAVREEEESFIKPLTEQQKMGGR